MRPVEIDDIILEQAYGTDSFTVRLANNFDCGYDKFGEYTEYPPLLSHLEAARAVYWALGGSGEKSTVAEYLHAANQLIYEGTKYGIDAHLHSIGKDGSNNCTGGEGVG